MNRLLASSLVLALAVTVGTASAQSYDAGRDTYPDGYANATASQVDYARVVRVDPVFDSGYASNQGQRCYDSPAYGGGNYDPYRNGRTYDGYRDDRRDGYYDQNGNYRSGSQTGSTVATVVGGVVGAVLGSQVGGGSARYATSAIGSMVGGMAGKQIYEQQQRQRNATTRVCDPVPVDSRYGSERAVNAYDVTYEYAGRRYTTRTNHHPGDRIRVRVDVRPE